MFSKFVIFVIILISCNEIVAVCIYTKASIERFVKENEKSYCVRENQHSFTTKDDKEKEVASYSVGQIKTFQVLSRLLKQSLHLL